MDAESRLNQDLSLFQLEHVDMARWSSMAKSEAVGND